MGRLIVGDVLIFTPRPRVPSPEPVPLGSSMRASLEEAMQAALDTADRLIAVLDGMDGDTDREDGTDAEPSLGAPEGHASQTVWLRGSDADQEACSPEVPLPDVATDWSTWSAQLPWSGCGNVVAATGVALLGLVGRGS